MEKYFLLFSMDIKYFNLDLDKKTILYINCEKIINKKDCIVINTKGDLLLLSKIIKTRKEELNSLTNLKILINNIELLETEKILKFIIINGGHHFNLTIFINSPKFVVFKPWLRSNIDYIFISKVDNGNEFKKMYNKICLEKNKILVINNNSYKSYYLLN